MNRMRGALIGFGVFGSMLCAGPESLADSASAEVRLVVLPRLEIEVAPIAAIEEVAVNAVPHVQSQVRPSTLVLKIKGEPNTEYRVVLSSNIEKTLRPLPEPISIHAGSVFPSADIESLRFSWQGTQSLTIGAQSPVVSQAQSGHRETIMLEVVY